MIKTIDVAKSIRAKRKPIRAQLCRSCADFVPTVRSGAEPEQIVPIQTVSIERTKHPVDPEPGGCKTDSGKAHNNSITGMPPVATGMIE